VPIKHLSTEDLAAGKKGIVGHHQVSDAFDQSEHWDPGHTFPWNDFMDLVAAKAEKIKSREEVNK